jgi:hypothetical protein
LLILSADVAEADAAVDAAAGAADADAVIMM